MGSILWVVHLYFGVMLGVSALAKIENPAFFAATLRTQRVLPRWSIEGVSNLFPWCELLIAFLLIISPGQGAALLLSALVLLLFGIFLGIEIALILRKQTTSCGCYGAAYQRKVDTPSLISSALLVMLAGCQLWLTTWVGQLNWMWGLVGAVLFCGMSGWLAWRMAQRRRAGKRIEEQRRQEFLRPLHQEGRQLTFSYDG
ncbi:MAG TPA: MauE/DoxX family redox-associated membrane protein [Ktedonobacteraceae bacterium]|nr:MauE/DoxX family redox-associated membrane protein [Ktedonobacteraceae bacterium]